MSHLVCLDGEHSTPASVRLALGDGEDATAAILALGHCPACPDTPLAHTSRSGVQVCPCCWSAWWTEDGVVNCTPGAVVVDEPRAAQRSGSGSFAA